MIVVGGKTLDHDLRIGSFPVPLGIPDHSVREASPGLEAPDHVEVSRRLVVGRERDTHETGLATVGDGDFRPRFVTERTALDHPDPARALRDEDPASGREVQCPRDLQAAGHDLHRRLVTGGAVIATVIRTPVGCYIVTATEEGQRYGRQERDP